MPFPGGTLVTGPRYLPWREYPSPRWGVPPCQVKRSTLQPGQDGVPSQPGQDGVSPWPGQDGVPLPLVRDGITPPPPPQPRMAYPQASDDVPPTRSGMEYPPPPRLDMLGQVMPRMVRAGGLSCYFSFFNFWFLRKK